MSVNPNDSGSAKLKRRQFVGLAAGALAGVSVVQLAAQAAADHQLTKRYGMLVDVNKCATGCRACVDACNDEHGLTRFDSPLTDAQWIRKVGLRHRRTGRAVEMPVMCQHCEDPPCVDVCPTGASFKRDDGIVLVDKHTCIGCRYCVMACPYRARSFVHENLTDQVPEAPRGKGTVEVYVLRASRRCKRWTGASVCRGVHQRRSSRACIWRTDGRHLCPRPKVAYRT